MDSPFMLVVFLIAGIWFSVVGIICLWGITYRIRARITEAFARLFYYLGCRLFVISERIEETDDDI